MPEPSDAKELLPAIELLRPEGCTPDAAVIWLHGLGASGNDFVPIVPELGIPSTQATRFVFPHAPEIPVTINGGIVMPAWYDILVLAIDRHIDRKQLGRSASRVAALIDREIERGIDSRRVFLAGFSQGGAVAYQAALGYPKPLGGLIALSTYVASSEDLQVHPQQKALSILVCHGLQDPVVPEGLGSRSVAILEERGLQVEYQTYPMEHAVCREEIDRIGAFLNQALGNARTLRN